MCRAVTGDARVTRKLYTDSDLAVVVFRRALLLTSIDPGAMRGDLADRLLPIELSPPDPKGRRSEEWLERKLKPIIPEVMGGLLDLTVQVLANPVEVEELPRMADAARVMAAVDAQRGTNSLGAFLEVRKGLNDTVFESDPVAAAVDALLHEESGRWKGTATDLLRDLERHGGYKSKSWPRSARSLSQRLTRLAPALRESRGIEMVRHDNARPRQIELRERQE